MSITLTNPTLVEVNGATVENDTDGAATLKNNDYLANQLVFTLRTGTLQSGDLNAGNYGPYVTVTVDLATGNWWSSDSSANGPKMNGTMSASDLANFQSGVAANRNMIEAFAAGPSGIMPGTQVPWTGSKKL
jgi:hypothetical protein